MESKLETMVKIESDQRNNDNQINAEYQDDILKQHILIKPEIEDFKSSVNLETQVDPLLVELPSKEEGNDMHDDTKLQENSIIENQEKGRDHDFQLQTDKAKNMEPPEVEMIIDANLPSIVAPSNLQSTLQPFVKKVRKQKSYRKKVEGDWSYHTTLKLIQEIEKRRRLWDTGCADYKLPKEILWQEVSDAVDMSLNDCKGKWANLRTTFNSNLGKNRKRKSKGANESVSITWKYFKQMSFLKANKVLRSIQSTSHSSLKLDSALSFLENVERGTPSHTTAGKHIIRKVPTSTPLPCSSSDTSQSQSSTFKQIAVEALQSMRSYVSKPKNASTALCEYMDAELNNLTPDQAVFARSKLLRAFNEIMDEVAMMPSSQQ